ncbi:MAG TPA: penicillin acylase family protein [Pyrinomonadaceae bacterium]|nr:penicillin acylase family protein [Pyrinomonadaceae bacterium]
MKKLVRRTLKVLAGLVVLVVLLLAVGTVGGYLYLSRSLPVTDGTLRLEGLHAPVEVVRDADAVAHIYARNELDAYRALGFVHAQERLWQMEMQRRVASGTLAEIYGSAAISNDRFLRTVGLHRAAESAWQTLPSDTKQVVEAYVAGINQYISSRAGSGIAPEFKMMGFTPPPWTGSDVLAGLKLLAWQLDNISYSTELLHADLINKVGTERAQELMPEYSAAEPVTLASNTHGTYERLVVAADEVATLANGVGGVNYGGLGSNAWVIAGAKSVTGKPILANDPHLGSSIPTLWYLAHLNAGDLDVIGATIPGLPFIVTGRNRHIAWGLTHLVADVQDVYHERLDGDGRTAEFKGQPEALRVVEEKIRVKGGPEVKQVVRITRHGPLLSDAINANDAQMPPDRRPTALEPLALQWTGLEEQDTTLRSFIKVNRANNWNEFKEGLRDLRAPALSFVYADVDGNIGYYAAGNVPVRSSGEGTLPTEGWTGATEWNGAIGFENMPQAFNPPCNFIIAANNRPVSNEYPYFLGRQWAASYRARRITDLLQAKEKLSLDDNAAIQGDTVSLQLRELAPLLTTFVSPQNDVERRALELLKNSDGNASGSSAATAIFESWFQQLAYRLTGDDLGLRLLSRYEERFDYVSRFLTTALKDPASPWCDDINTPEHESCNDIMSQTFRRTLGDLRSRLGSDMQNWRWDRLHVAVFPHQPFHRVAVVRELFSRSIPNGGDRSTVNSGPYGFNRDFEQYASPGYRQLISLGDLNDGRFILSTGQSGHFLSSHYDDYLKDWQAVRYRPMRLGQQQGGKTLTLQP